MNSLIPSFRVLVSVKATPIVLDGFMAPKADEILMAITIGADSMSELAKISSRACIFPGEA
jgi:hypothetical protein